MTWSVMDSDGVASSEGLTEERAIAIAQQRANETGRTWTAYDASAGEDGESVECEPDGAGPILDETVAIRDGA